MWELDLKKDGHWRIDVFKLWYWRRLLRIPWTTRRSNRSRIKPVNPKGNQPWIFTGRNDAKAPILWPPDAKSRHVGKDPDTGKDWRQKEKGVTENKMVRRHHQLVSVQFSSVAQSRPALCNPMDCSTPGFPIHHQLLELAQTHVHQAGDIIQPSHPLLSPSPVFHLSHH